ncbi:hypothetical protein LTR47_010863 [Exophiala xenobiotica]|nr:hypothetical protein LTR92_011110 [Exophiala xenobiotica]KAK5215700.1 hypothetical protein LTR72_011254 [Exophiala xenobiotica]KAK5221574.1 hypothetical protein LTR47_010863 [Exophiala xenobiotica]KAK5245447.1 hypothetical protein LTS06_009116 [Exophiala xenobiotica]KAK5282107.1 hypothetical protein LTR40_003775 [Exophiala xenobiotica]
MSGPGAYQNMPHSGSPTGHYQPSGGYGQMGGPYPGNYQGRPAEAHSGSYDPRYPGRDQHYGSGYEHGGPPRMYGSPPQTQAPYYGAQDGHGNQPGAYGQHGYERRDEHNYGAGGPGYEQRPLDMTNKDTVSMATTPLRTSNMATILKGISSMATALTDTSNVHMVSMDTANIDFTRTRSTYVSQYLDSPNVRTD